MARAIPKPATDAPRDAIALLKQDHRAVERLFKEFESADDDQLQAIAERVCQLLTVHAQIEEELLYPQAKEALEDEEGIELVNEANIEHQTAKDLIARVEAMTPEDETFKATMKVLSEYVKHHVKEEENELFPTLKKETELDLKDMGAQLFERKMSLMQEMGIEMDTEQAPARRSATGRSGKSSAAKSRQAHTGGRRSASRSGRAARH